MTFFYERQRINDDDDDDEKTRMREKELSQQDPSLLAAIDIKML